MLVIVYHYYLLTAISKPYNKHLYAEVLAMVFTSSMTWLSKQLVPYLSQQVTQVMKDLYTYSLTGKQPINFKKSFLDTVS